VKEDFNIEQLFQEKFNSFESDVAPDAWSNIQQSMQTGAGGGSGAGMSTWVKGIILGTGLGAAVVGGVYLSSDDTDALEDQKRMVNIDASEQLETEKTYPSEFAEDTKSSEEAPNQSNEEMSDHEQASSDQMEGNEAEELTETNNRSTDDLASGVNGSASNNVSLGDGESETSGDNSDQPDPSEDDETNASDTSEDGDVDPDSQRAPLESPKAALTYEKGTDENYSRYTFNSNAENATNVSWDFGDGKVLTGENVTHTYSKPGTYTVTMTVTGKHDVITDVAEIEIQPTSNIGVIPNVFTPNNDGRNDEFLIQSTEIAKFAIVIRNDKGTVVFDSADPDFHWDGSDKMNNPVPSGTYTYQIIAVGKDQKEFSEAGQLRVESE